MENEMLDKAQALLKSSAFDHAAYHALENYILKNGSRLKDDADFKTLKSIMDEIASKQNLTPISKIQENFGLNSCAQ